MVFRDRRKTFEERGCASDTKLDRVADEDHDKRRKVHDKGLCNGHIMRLRSLKIYFYINYLII